MNQSRSALIVDDERDIRELLTLTLGRMGLRIDTAANVGEARELLARNTYDLCFTDMRLPDGNGIDLVGEIARNYPNTPVAMITAFGNIELAVEALKAGAFDFVSKPVDLAVLRGLPLAGVLCELMNPDGSMARGAQVARFARAHGLLCTTVRALADYRRARQP